MLDEGGPGRKRQLLHCHECGSLNGLERRVGDWRLGRNASVCASTGASRLLSMQSERLYARNISGCSDGTARSRPRATGRARGYVGGPLTTRTRAEDLPGNEGGLGKAAHACHYYALPGTITCTVNV